MQVRLKGSYTGFAAGVQGGPKWWVPAGSLAVATGSDGTNVDLEVPALGATGGDATAIKISVPIDSVVSGDAQVIFQGGPSATGKS